MRTAYMSEDEQLDQGGAIATIALDAPGIVRVRIFPGVVQSVASARTNLVAAIEARGGRTRPILVDIKGCFPLSNEVRRVYMGKAITSSFSAIAMVVDASPLGRMIGNLYLRVADLQIPARLFSTQQEALRWLRLFVPASS